MKKNFRIFIFVFFVTLSKLVAQIQPIPIGTWRSHFDYTKGKCLAKAGNKIFYAAQNGLFVYDIADNEVTILNTDNGFSELIVNQLAFHSPSNTLVVSYKSGLIDLIKLDSKFEIADVKTLYSIKNSTSILGSKTIHQIVFNESFAYLAADFGIVKVDLNKKVISEIDENLGENGKSIPLYSITFFNEKIVAVSDSFLLEASNKSNINLQFFGNWQRLKLPVFANNISQSNNKVVVFENEIQVGISEKGIFTYINNYFTRKLILDQQLADIQVNGASAFICLQNKIINLETKEFTIKTIVDGLIKAPRKIAFDGDKIWIADGLNGLLSNSKGSFLKYNPINTAGLITVRNDSIVTDQLGITFTKLAPGNGLQISNATGKKINFSRIPLNDSDNSRASYTVNSLAIDKNNTLFIATDGGIVALNPDLKLLEANSLDGFISTLKNADGKRILQTDIVLSVAVDGGNRKWVGTNSSLYLFNESLSDILQIFTNVNSPLPSNTINFLNLEPNSGELFVYTPNGIVSYRTNATEGADIQENTVLVFPNPVKPEFDGLVGVSGLVANAFVKITDIAGRLVYQTQANGGTATWDLNTKNGRRAEGGIYFIFSGNELGKETFVTKLAVIK